VPVTALARNLEASPAEVLGAGFEQLKGNW
jgi:hypothetical protein